VEFSWEVLLLLFAIAALAGWIDTLAGGGGLLVLPALLFAGVPPLQALATNKCQGFVGTFTATATLYFKKKLPTEHLIRYMLLTAIGAALGTLLIQRIDTAWLDWAIPVLLLTVAAYFLFAPHLGKNEGEAKISGKTWSRTFVPCIGFYDGFFGPGTGSFFAASLVVFRGKNLVDATILAKPLNFTSNIVSLIVFAFGGQVVWLVGIVMMAGQVLGAFLGTHTIFWGGAKLIRPLVIFMCVAMSLNQLRLLVG
jgi:uncharacterized membrane protein YfcA